MKFGHVCRGGHHHKRILAPSEQQRTDEEVIAAFILLMDEHFTAQREALRTALASVPLPQAPVSASAAQHYAQRVLASPQLKETFRQAATTTATAMRKPFTQAVTASGQRAADQAASEAGRAPFKFNADARAVTDEVGKMADRVVTEVDATTMDGLEESITQSVMDEQRIADFLDQEPFLDKTRAQMIARTEGIRAENAGKLQAWKQSGFVEGKIWVLQDEACDFCVFVADKFNAENAIPLDQSFFKKGQVIRLPDGKSMSLDYSDVDYPPLHPNCRCEIVPVYMEMEKTMKDMIHKALVADMVPEESTIESSHRFRAVISTDALDDDREVMMPGGMDKQDFMKNPILLWSHDTNHPIGKVLSVTKMMDNSGWEMEAELAARPSDWAPGVEWFPDKLWGLIKAGVLKGISVGAKALEVRNPTAKDRAMWGDTIKRIINRWKLFEVSLCSIGSNQDALVYAVSKGILTVDEARKDYGMKSVDDPAPVAVVVPAADVIPAAIEPPKPEPIKKRIVCILVATPPDPINNPVNIKLKSNAMVRGKLFWTPV